jgi:hypothetical protein
VKNLVEALVEKLSDERRLKIQVFRNGIAGAVKRRAGPKHYEKVLCHASRVLQARKKLRDRAGHRANLAAIHSISRSAPERSSVDLQGHPRTVFVRALERVDVTAAMAAAKQMGGLELGDALALCVVLAERDPDRYRRAAPRWVSRFIDEAGDVPLEEIQLIVAALSALPAAPHLARPVLREFVQARQIVTVRSIFEDVMTV